MANGSDGEQTSRESVIHQSRRLMANSFTTLCVDILKTTMERACPGYDWYAEQSVSVDGARISVDICAAKGESRVYIEFEMHRRHPDRNVYKLIKMATGKKSLILHIFSPFYEVGTYYSRTRECETTVRDGLRKEGIPYVPLRWDLDSCPSVRKACQVLPESSDHFPPDNEIKGAIAELAKELKAHISDWEAQVASP